MQQHITVLAEEAIEGLNINPSSVIVDATLGSGGHAALILEKLGEDGALIALDADASAIAHFGAKEHRASVHLVQRNFRDIDAVLKELNRENVDGILADLGWRMEQFDGGGKGFSFLIDEPLLMTFGDPDTYPFTAKTIVNEWKEKDIKNVLKGYGEERFAGRIARRIVEVREKAPIESSGELAEIIWEAVPGFYRVGRIHPATRSFQALRIAVNDELDALETFIQKAAEALKEDGRLVIITFHSIEDRIVKHRFKALEADGKGKVLTKKPITAGEGELRENPRARSAKLRIFGKLHESYDKDSSL